MNLTEGTMVIRKDGLTDWLGLSMLGIISEVDEKAGWIRVKWTAKDPLASGPIQFSTVFVPALNKDNELREITCDNLTPQVKEFLKELL